MQPPDLSKCPRFIRKWLQLVVAYARSRTPLTSSIISFSDAAGGEGRIPLITLPNSTSNPSALVLHPYSILDASNASQAKLVVTPGNHLDSTNGMTWIPQINGVNITNATPPQFNVTNVDTAAWFEISVIALDGSNTGNVTGQITAIDINCGATAPNSTNVLWIQLVSNISVQSGPNIYYVSSLNSGVSGSQVSQPCPAQESLLLGLQ